MKTTRQQFGFTPKLLALMLLVAFGAAQAEEEEDDEDDGITRLTVHENTIGVGLGAVARDSKDRAIFGQYNGLRKDDVNLLFDADIEKRSTEEGTLFELKVKNLGLDNREAKIEFEKQGDYEVYAIFSEITRRDIHTINTGLLNAETTAPTVVSLAAPGAGTDLNLDIKRRGITVGAEKWLTPNLFFEASFKNEDKDGARLSGIGLACSTGGNFTPISRFLCGDTGAVLMLPEPINYTTKQLDAKLNFSGENFLLSGGYYGSFFNNSNGSLNPAISGNLWNPNGSPLDTGAAPGSTLAGYLQQPFALPPDNQAHQLFVSGNYAFSPATRATFKYAHTHATQHDSFAGMGLTGAPAGVGNLGGVVDSSIAQVGLTARPTAKLSMLANLRYEEKRDKTPLAWYDSDSSGAVRYTNDLNSSRKVAGKLEASYQLPDNYRATVGVDYASVHRDRPVATSSISDLALALTSLREETQELGYRAELRHSMSETFNASVSFGQSQRDGWEWLNLVPGTPTVPDSAIYNASGTFPMTMADRQRDKFRLSADWLATEDLSLQFTVENLRDGYTAPSEKGVHGARTITYGVDAALKLSEEWRATAYANRGSQTLNLDHSVGYIAELENVSTSLGMGVSGKPSDKLEVGGDLSYLDDANRYTQSMSSGAPLAGGGLPDITYRMTSLKLYGKYALEKNADLRIDMGYQRLMFDEWTWENNGVPFAYSDNTTVSMQQHQNVTYLGVSYIFKFR
ncbi:MAG: hypothetical protein A2Z65_04200 [Gallionellales bacterium RIFCSPLOWO2_02_58_13]|nr:MAG: hypothetical protein A2Z65_04200 [Gallionellales bacterium RIFCSPLOWO2_02_58_13]